MDLPLHDPAFWARYTFAYDEGPGFERLGDLADSIEPLDLGEDDEDVEGVEVFFDVGEGYRLVLDVCLELDLHELGVLVPGEPETASLGWDDIAHWHPHVFRWSELETICRAVDGERHPGPALALLCRFAAVFDDDDVEAAAAQVDAAHESLRPAGWTGYWPTAADWLARNDLRGQNVTWHTDDAGRRWAVQTGHNDKDLYTRRQGPKKFPHRKLARLLAVAQTAG
ncbi:hypothetical protein [Actinoplanes utahensis]|uniref:Uncharacterized protein n=1 Tax=Actinoplanes utahensis TaxID=1869 RepID=A0A0A6UL02_ACTUT|nr:hypothetical protein [Actinoplanes utahensis]KHD75753.1 hypothetical protein MB27_21315 [Actinoplanes utahensis]GIF34487.1 hypothetical protein Aut01nite_74730 [Actinoplanes utahensis]